MKTLLTGIQTTETKIKAFNGGFTHHILVRYPKEKLVGYNRVFEPIGKQKLTIEEHPVRYSLKKWLKEFVN